MKLMVSDIYLEIYHPHKPFRFLEWNNGYSLSGYKGEELPLLAAVPAFGRLAVLNEVHTHCKLLDTDPKETLGGDYPRFPVLSRIPGKSQDAVWIYLLPGDGTSLSISKKGKCQYKLS